MITKEKTANPGGSLSPKSMLEAGEKLLELPNFIMEILTLDKEEDLIAAKERLDTGLKAPEIPLVLGDLYGEVCRIARDIAEDKLRLVEGAWIGEGKIDKEGEIRSRYAKLDRMISDKFAKNWAKAKRALQGEKQILPKDTLKVSISSIYDIEIQFIRDLLFKYPGFRADLRNYVKLIALEAEPDRLRQNCAPIDPPGFQIKRIYQK